MKTLYLLLIFLTCTCLQAQDGGVLRVEPAEINKEVVVDNLEEHFEDVTSIVVTNNSGRSIRLARQTVRRPQPAAWSYRALDRLSRTTPYVLSANEQENGRYIPLAPGQSATFYVVLRPDGVTGSGSTELQFSDLTVPGATLATARVSTVIRQRAVVPVAAPSPTSVRLYPNPATERFFVETPQGTTISRIEVTNTLGRQIRSFDGPADVNGYDIRKLPDGLYLISIYDTTGKKLKTLRLLHRAFGA
ncbi:hypothetical protein LEM8419_03381 [Neolewinella maritima]|uniref:Secretion system C-terminal sorting domain-containing protein n=1 Tax=Neolewinella maritima TaxID=1383882 RepID=A0ABN8F6D5_9BACT|nr:T9SS type A sorting domain-containing protein [Neolewinella maritima]CAH1002502.1 hypothetical protein LEM8419_03381 [Neolewinella maritima]